MYEIWTGLKLKGYYKDKHTKQNAKYERTDVDLGVFKDSTRCGCKTCNTYRIHSHHPRKKTEIIVL